MIDCQALYAELTTEFCNTEDVDSPLHPRSDIAAMLLLHKIKPGTCSIICGIGHNEIIFDVSIEYINEHASREQVLELIRYGVTFRNCVGMYI